MSSELEQLAAVGNEITAGKYYIVATCTVLFYDYFLTLGDEVNYAWSGRRTWAFSLFLINRYFPMSYQFWLLAINFTPEFNTTVCNKTAFYPILAFGICTLLAQVVLTLRIYAVTMKSVPVAIAFGVITIAQFSLGVYMMNLARREGAGVLPPIPLDAYHVCIFIRHRNLELAYTSISIFYDSLAFLLIMFLAAKTKTPGLRVESILGTIAADAMRYFLVIFTAHFVLILTLNLAPEPIQLLPGPGLPVYLPVMISRIMLSLKKAAHSQQKGWTLTEPTANGNSVLPVQFSRSQRGTNGRQDGIQLDTFVASQTVTH